MAAKEDRSHGEPRCSVEVSPSEVDAGAELTMTVRASCPHGCDLRGQGVSIRGQDDTELASTKLAELDGETYVASALALRAPLQVGPHRYRAVLAAHEKGGILHEETSTELSFVSLAHAASVNVWDLPSAIAAGERFKLSVGIKCSSGCKLAGRPLRVFEDEGAQVAAGSLAEDVWPGTAALYFAEVDAQAPPTIGDHQWKVEIPASDSGVPHAAGSCTFLVKVVSPPDHEVTVEAFDSETQAPIEGLHILLHPYRAVTDQKGMAKAKVAKGQYTLVVSGFRYVAHEAILDVTADVATRVVLTAEPEGQDDYH